MNNQRILAQNRKILASLGEDMEIRHQNRRPSVLNQLQDLRQLIHHRYRLDTLIIM